MRICGLMTGTSLDGIDCAIADFWKEGNSSRFELLAYCELPLENSYKQDIFRIIEQKSGAREISEMNFRISRLYLDAIKYTCNENRIPYSSLDMIGMHGQTVWHEPGSKGHTLQLGSISALSALSGLPVAGDFRSGDIALGGQGAPLVPVFDYHFLRSEHDDVIALNIGGMANLTYLPAGRGKDKVTAFDTGPGNVWIDTAVREYFNIPYDKSGEIAGRGRLIPELLAALMDIPFINQKPPKSTGRELFTKEYLYSFIKKHTSGAAPEDIIHSLSAFTVNSIVKNIEMTGIKTACIYVSGGGAKNDFIIEKLSQELQSFRVMTSDEAGIPGNAKEALAFAFLAYMHYLGEPSNLPSVTGASREIVLGLSSKL
ncbi:MAG: anhydro-N-acetylmuramic acid kinase [Candidatus Kapaibacterium sp.]